MFTRPRRTPVMAVADYLGRHGPLRQRMRVERFALFLARPEVGGGPYLREALYPLRGGPFRREP